MVQKITIELDVESPNGLSDFDLGEVKEAVKRTLYEYDNFTQILLEDEYNLVFLFDPEDEAQERARAAARDIAACGNKVWVARADLGKNPKGEPRDPGDLTPAEAQELMSELMRS